jgi:hypothetical protein
VQHGDLGGKAKHQCANGGRKYTVKWVPIEEWGARPYITALAVATKHVGSQVNKGVKDSGLFMVKLIDYSNKVNQGDTNDVGASVIVRILGLLHTFNNASTNIMPKHCTIVVKVRMLTLHPNMYFIKVFWAQGPWCNLRQILHAQCTCATYRPCPTLTKKMVCCLRR